MSNLSEHQQASKLSLSNAVTGVEGKTERNKNTVFLSLLVTKERFHAELREMVWGKNQQA